MAIYEGGCHCGRIAFTVEGEIESLYECNCSLCAKRGALHWFVPGDAFALKTAESDAAEYRFNKRTLRHRFCQHCGVAPFSQGEKPGAGPMVAVNARCLDAVDPKAYPIVAVDGRSF